LNPARRPSPLSTVALYAGFAATGIGMALPGSVLPALLVQWSLSDRQAGFLFFLIWMGSSVGALLVRGSMAGSVARGALLLACASLAVACGPAWALFPAMAAFGLGLGIAMTSISLLRVQRIGLSPPEIESTNLKAMELNRLNLAWALGACLCPTLAAHSIRVVDVRGIFGFVSGFFVLLFLWATYFERDSPPNSVQKPARSGRPQSGFRLAALRVWPPILIVMICLPGGIESTLGGWIAAYVQRTQQTVSTTVTAGVCFWAGMLLSRALSSTRLLICISERRVLLGCLATVAAGAILLIAAQSSLLVLPAVALIGLGLGPVYPLILAQALKYSTNTLIFSIAGLGSAFLPWLTGVASTAAGSLRTGLFLPCAAALLLLGLALCLPAGSTPYER
jgi:fucose permease